MYGRTCLLDYEDFMTRYVPPPVVEREPEELFCMWTPTKQIRPQNPRDKGASCINAWLKYADNDDNLKEAGSDTSHGYQAAVTANKIDPLDSTRQPCVLALYPAFLAPRDRAEEVNWAAIEVLFECKPDAGQDDPFDEDTDKFEPNSERRRDNLNQIMSHATLIFTRQHRAHLFTVVLFGNMARIIRWDHSGLTVTKKFNYHREPIKLSRFLWRLCHLSAAQRGHDPTVTRVLSRTDEDDLIEARAEQPILEQGVEIGQHARLMFKDTITSKTERYKISINGRYFLVGRPHFESSEFAGRGTRGYVAIDCDNPNGPLVYLKDTWRVAHDGIQREGDVLEYLNDEAIGDGRVDGVPTLVCHGDIEDQQTTTQDVWKAQHPDSLELCPLKTHRHYRIVVQEVGLYMDCFQNAAELVYLICLCIQAHGQAYRKKVIHRDVSAGNVLIHVRESVVDGQLVQERIGLLTDWELSKRTDLPDIARQPDRTGTWRFMSAYTLSNPEEPVGVPDEIEAFFHVLLFFAVRYLLHNYEDVGGFMFSYFDGCVTHKGEYYCGQLKYAAMHQGAISIPGSGPLVFRLPPGFIPPHSASGSPPPQTHILNDLIASLLRLFSARYTLLQLDSTPLRDINEVPQPPAGAVAQPSGQIARMRQRLKALSRATSARVVKVKHAQPDITPEKRAELVGLAEQLQSHEDVIALYASFFGEEQELQWPPQDTVPDQLPKDYRPKNDTPQEERPTAQPATGSKRVTMADEAEREYPGTKRQLRSSGKPVN